MTTVHGHTVSPLARPVSHDICDHLDAGAGLRLHTSLVQRDGATAPPLLLLHGFTGSSDTWTSLRTALGDTYSTLAVDLPGHGASTAPSDPGRYALDRTADDLLQVLDRFDIARVVVLGYSLGGRVALRFALAHSDRVAAVVLESASPGIADPAERAARVASDAALADRIERDGVATFVDTWERLPLWASQLALPPATRGQLRAQRLTNDARGLANSLRGAGAGVDPPVLDALVRLAVPTLLVAGALDAKYVAAGRVIASVIPGAELAIVPEAGHAVHLERPDAFAALVRDFLFRHFDRQA